MKKKFAIGGGLFGALLFIGVMSITDTSGHGSPGLYELLFQVAIVAVLAAGCAVTGLLIGWLGSLVWPQKKEKKA